MTIQVLNANEARQKFRDMVDTVHAGQADVVIERYDKPMVVVIPYEDYQALQEELDDLRTGRRAAVAYEAWKKEPSRGRPWEEIEADLTAEGLLDAE